jgi:outer membrane protein, multidrug efflux system
MIRNKLSVSLMIFLIAGCSLAPAYNRPAAPVPAVWPTGPAYKESGGDGTVQRGAEIGWRQFYSDEKLQRVIELALGNNRDSRVAALNVERVQALYRIQRAELFPAVNASAGLLQQRIPVDTSQVGGAYNIRQESVNIGVSNWEADFFGRIRSLKDKALEQYLATEQASRSTRISLIAEVANVYLTLAADRDNLNFARSTLEAQLETFNLIRRRTEVGTSSELDLRQAQTRVETARVDMARYTRQVALDVNALSLLTGSPVPADLLPNELNAVVPPGDVSAGLSSTVLLQRPDILQAESQLKAAYANIGAARAALFPRITLTGTVGTTSDELSGLFKAGSNTWTFSPQITMPIFDARLWAALDSIKVEREMALAQYEKAIQTAFREVADALAQRGTVMDLMAAQESLVLTWAETYRLSEARYTKGIDGYLGVLEAQRSLYAAQQGLISTRLSRLTNLVTLYKVLGGGWFADVPVKEER